MEGKPLVRCYHLVGQLSERTSHNIMLCDIDKYGRRQYIKKFIMSPCLCSILGQWFSITLTKLKVHYRCWWKYINIRLAAHYIFLTIHTCWTRSIYIVHEIFLHHPHKETTCECPWELRQQTFLQKGLHATIFTPSIYCKYYRSCHYSHRTITHWFSSLLWHL